MPHKDLKDYHNEVVAMGEKQGAFSRLEFEENVVIKPTEKGGACPCCSDIASGHDYHLDISAFPADRQAKIAEFILKNPTRKADAR